MINIYILQNYSLVYIDFFIFSLASILLIDKIIFYIFRSSNNLTKLFGAHDKHEFSLGMIISLFIVSLLPKTIQYMIF